MSAPEISSTFDERFIELVELLLEQHLASESRRESADSQQLEVLNQVQSQISTLARCVEALAQGSVPSVRIGSTEQNRTDNSNSSPALTEWERQKQLILQGLDPNISAADPTTSPTEQTPAPSFNKACEPVPAEPTSHDWIEHLDPNDPALSDDSARRELVARLRKLEVELSLQRAKLARERSEFETQLNEFEQARRQQGFELSSVQEGDKKDSGRVDRMLRFLGRKKE